MFNIHFKMQISAFLWENNNKLTNFGWRFKVNLHMCSGSTFFFLETTAISINEQLLPETKESRTFFYGINHY